MGASICASEVSERRRELNVQPERLERIARLRGGVGPREVSPAGRKALRANAAAIPHRPGRKRTITEQTRAQIRAEVQSGASQTEVAARHGIALHRESHPLGEEGEIMTGSATGTVLAKRAADAKAALNSWIVAQRAEGRTLQDIADECGMTRAGVLYVVRSANEER